jgi:hypothetical protein
MAINETANLIVLNALVFIGLFRWRSRRRGRRRVVAAVVGREDAEQKFTAHAGVGRVSRRPLQIGGVLNG